MEVVIYQDKEKWNTYVHQHADSIAWHVYEWNEVVQKHYKTEFIPLAALDQGEIQGVFPLFQLNDQFYSVAYAVAGGMLFSHHRAEKALLDYAVELSKHKKIEKITLKQYKNKITGPLITDKNYYNKELNLKDSLDTIWNHLDRKNREVLHLFKDDEYELVFDDQLVDPFYQMLFKFMHQNGTPCVSHDWIKTLIDFKMYRIAVLKKNGKMIAATLTKEFKNTVSFPFSCALSNQMRHIKGLYYLYWALIKHYKNRDFNIFHSGRIPQNNDTASYRLGWGGKKINYYYQYYTQKNTDTEFTSKRGLKRKLLSFAWRWTPGFIINKMGPKIVAKFP